MVWKVGISLFSFFTILGWTCPHQHILLLGKLNLYILSHINHIPSNCLHIIAFVSELFNSKFHFICSYIFTFPLKSNYYSHPMKIPHILWTCYPQWHQMALDPSSPDAYVNYGMNWCTNYPLLQHQQNQSVNPPSALHNRDVFLKILLFKEYTRSIIVLMLQSQSVNNVILTSKWESQNYCTHNFIGKVHAADMPCLEITDCNLSWMNLRSADTLAWTLKIKLSHLDHDLWHLPSKCHTSWSLFFQLLCWWEVRSEYSLYK